MRTININESLKKSVKVDFVKVSFNCQYCSKDYDEATKEVSDKINSLVRNLVKIGFKEDDLKTENFGVNCEYRYVEENHQSKKELVGYNCYNTSVLTFDFNKEILSKVIKAVEENIEFSIKFTVKDEEEARNELIKEILEKAKEKAKMISRGLKEKLGDVQSITYSSKEGGFYSSTEFRPLMLENSRAQFNVNPKDVEMSEAISVVWEIL